MQPDPIHRRDYHVFLSHSSKDKAQFVEKLFYWLSEVAEIPTWYDRNSLKAGAAFPTFLARSIEKSRAMILVLSKSSVESGWVQEEIDLAIEQQKRFPEFKIIPIRIDDCDVSGFLQTRTYFQAQTGEPTLDVYDAILQSLYYDDVNVQFDKVKDVYVSRTWRDSEAPFADAVCRAFVDSGFRLIGDAEDQPSYHDSKSRVRNMISSCGGLVAVLPRREDNTASGCTSPYMLEEIAFARELGVPYIIFAEQGVCLSDDMQRGAAFFVQSSQPDSVDIVPASGRALTKALQGGIEKAREVYRKEHMRHYVFFATNFNNPERNQIVSKTIQRVTGMRCIIGKRRAKSIGISIQQEIVEQVKGAFLVIGDISQDSVLRLEHVLGEASVNSVEALALLEKMHTNVNTLIELGVARGANVPHLMLSRQPSRKPPFLLRDEEIIFYRDDAELLGAVHKLVYPFRRRVLNNEL